MKPLEYLQKTFLGGMNQRVDPTRLEGDAYYLLVNGRVRKDIVEPIRKPLPLTSITPQGKYQGIYAAGQYSILLVDGKAYIKNNEDINTAYVRIVDFQLDPNVDNIFAELVPASTWDYARAYQGSSFLTTNPQETASEPLTSYNNEPSITNAGSEVAAIFNDGINQPIAVTSQGTARQLQTFTEWNKITREYVPVGKQIVEYDGIVYIVSPDGREIFRSVSGRPMDFMVPISNEGDKLQGGDASSVSVRVSYNVITCITKTNLASGIFVGTKYDSKILVPRTDVLIFSEPTYRKVDLFPTGPLNQFSIVDLNGDIGFIDYGGIRSFNATESLQVESNNTPLSSPVANLFQGVSQTVTACADFDDYAFFAVNTIYGYGVLVYDKTLEKFVSFDQYAGVGIIRQFAVIKTSIGRKLLFITTDNVLYEAFAGTEVERVQLYIGEWCSNNPSIEHKTMALNTIFLDASSAGELDATLYVDRKLGKQQTRTIRQTASDVSLPIEIPFGNTEEDNVQNISFNFQDVSPQGWKVGFLLEWQCQANLSHIRVETSPTLQRKASIEQQARDFVAASNS